MPSTNLNDLNSNLLPLAEDFLQKCKDAGLDIRVTCTYRSAEEQNLLYSYGRTRPNPNNPDKPWSTATNAKGGESGHNFTINGEKPAAEAFDIVPMQNGQLDWDADFEAGDPWLDVAAVWRSMKPINGYYLDWYGRKGAPFREYAHFCLKAL